MIVSERAENAFQGELALQLTRKWKDQSGTWREGFIGYREISTAEQTRYGFHPIVEALPFAQFDARSPYLPNDFGSQVYGLKLQAKKGDHFRISAPQTSDTRRITILKRKTGQSSQAYTPLDQMAILWDWYNSIDYKFEDAGEYYLFVTRRNNLETNHAIQISLQLSRNGRGAPSIPLTPLTAEEFADVGCHPPAHKSLNVTIDPAKNPMGLGVSWGTFLPFALTDLNVRQGDRLYFRSLPVYGKTATTHIVRETSDKKLEIVQTFYSWYHQGDYTIPTAGRYMLAVVRDEELGTVEAGTIEIDHYRATRAGPAEVRYRPMATEEAAPYGYFPMGRFQFRNEKLTPAHPTGFVYSEQSYQLYRFILPTKTRVILNKGDGGLGERRFVLSQVDDARWASGQASLIDKLRTYSWYRTNSIDLEPGKYVLAVEGDLPKGADGKRVEAATPWEMLLTTLNSDPRTIKGQTLSFEQLKDPRYRLVQ